LRLILWGLGNAAVALGLLVVFAFSLNPRLPPFLRTIWWVVDAGAAGVFLASIPITYFLQRLNFEMRWYIVTDRSLRIRSGVVWLQEMTMTFANIQEIRVNANPIERWLGLANVEVCSAGGGGSNEHGMPSSGHVGKFAGVDNAAVIRDLIVERLRVYRDSGLGEKTVEVGQTPALSEPCRNFAIHQFHRIVPVGQQSGSRNGAGHGDPGDGGQRQRGDQQKRDSQPAHASSCPGPVAQHLHCSKVPQA
jgi:membrane protein YdbS with pleckstrin-like domain